MQIKKSSFTFFAIIILTLLLISSCIRQVETSSYRRQIKRGNS